MQVLGMTKTCQVFVCVIHVLSFLMLFFFFLPSICMHHPRLIVPYLKFICQLLGMAFQFVCDIHVLSFLMSLFFFHLSPGFGHGIPVRVRHPRFQLRFLADKRGVCTYIYIHMYVHIYIYIHTYIYMYIY